ncbi:acyl carrier protein [uncultured Variovorax sp.]|uniref:acyl carrier protein n=1 Tax=uncultured Variovorax sp. TaxID=114708 RepID=UPI0025D88D7A|nr:phosphopantetheine-binding protein [uncultured Variovorax sp.]
MSITVTPEFIASLKAMVLEAVEKGSPPGGLGDDEPLFGPDSRLDLDSLDALQVSMTIQQRFGVRMPDSKETRRALTSIAHLAEHLSQALKAGRAGPAGKA